MMEASSRKPKYNLISKSSPRKKAYSLKCLCWGSRPFRDPFPNTKCRNKANNVWVWQNKYTSTGFPSERNRNLNLLLVLDTKR